jgi:hypothetical protein
MCRIALTIGVLLLTGCATWGTRESRVILPTGEEYRIYAQHDAQFHYKKGDVEIKVDNRGRPSLIEQALQAPLVGVVGTAGNLLQQRMVKE